MTARRLALGLLLVVLTLIIRENFFITRPDRIHITTAGRVDMCLSCHQDVTLDPAHAPDVLGCSPCHLGNALAIDKATAHQGMLKNPGDLRHIEKTCGIEGCHSRDVKKVKNSLMATNRGIIATLLYYWGEAPDQNGDYSVEQLMATGKTSLALDYYRKLCGTCHLWKQKGDLEGFFGEKGGGCTACHSVPQSDKPAVIAADGTTKKPHPLIIKKIPQDNCIRCHNRSGRIGLSYTGRFESEGYGTPYEDGGPSSQRLPGDRFFQKLTPDVHSEKGMVCIDCHTRNEIMGDGTRYAHYEEQLEIRCTTCHSAVPGVTSKGQKLNNIVWEDDRFALTGKLDDKRHPLVPPKKDACDYPGHQRLTCEACHSAWVPQCYGCHVKRDMRETHLDKLTLKETPGWWEEGRSYIRYETPMLAMWANEVVVVTPGCQDIVTLINEKGEPAGSFNSLTMAAINPHTTRKESRTCADCHSSPKTVGLGEGTVWQEADGAWRFKPLSLGVETVSGRTPALDGYVTIDGTPLQKSARKDLRPFNGDELSRILKVGLCLNCHTDPDDPALRGYQPNLDCPARRASPSPSPSPSPTPRP